MTGDAPRVATRAVTIAVAPNGGRRTQADHPALPIAPAELARTASACLEAGASMFHMHVRDRDGAHLLDAKAYRASIAAVETAVGSRMVIQITSEALGLYAPAEQMAVVRTVRPEAVSLALRELAPTENDEAAFAQFLAWLARENVAPQIILYTPEEVVRLADMVRRGLVPFGSLPVLYVLGRYAPGQRSQPADLLPFVACDAGFEDWMVCAFGERETACVTAGALLGGHARVGFENNLHLPDGSIAADNAASVRATAVAIKACGLSVADADMLREAWAGAAR